MKFSFDCKDGSVLITDLRQKECFCPWEEAEMPNANIEVRRKWPDREKHQLMDSLHRAMIQALKIPLCDKLIRLIEHPPENFVIPPSATENYTLVEITMFKGRSLEAKRELYKQIVQEFGRLGISPSDIRIVLYEVPMENWGIRGGIPASEVELGFKINV